MPVVQNRLGELVLIVAKAPVAGSVKTRLHGRFAAVDAAALAEAALVDTLAAAQRCRAGRRVVALDGPPGPWLAADFEVVGQGDGTLGERLATAWRCADRPCLQLGMDTPQVSARLLDHGFDVLSSPGTDAVLGLAEDGGWWALGLVHAVEGVFVDVPMSSPDTGARQLERLRSLGLRTRLLPVLRDMDRPADVDWLAAAHPSLQVARVAASLGGGRP